MFRNSPRRKRAAASGSGAEQISDTTARPSAPAAMTSAGEAAARLAEGPGSFLSRFLDALYLLDARHLEQRVFPA
jgi:hydroxyethylthiazole kinase-like sugar kinase family protein